MTNLEITRKYFKKAYFEHEDRYVLDDEFTIQWLENETFIVDRFYYDYDVGPVTDDDCFTGDFRQCLEFCLGEKLNAEDVNALNKLK